MSSSPICVPVTPLYTSSKAIPTYLMFPDVTFVNLPLFSLNPAIFMNGFPEYSASYLQALSTNTMFPLFIVASKFDNSFTVAGMYLGSF